MENKNLVLGLCIILALAGSVSAAGIVSPYWGDHPLTMNYGDTKIVNFNLQNMVGSEEITVEVFIKQGGDIASLEQTRYTARAGTSDTLIPLTIAVPGDYDKGVQKVELEIKTVMDETEGMITLGTGWSTSFNVVLSDKPVSKNALMGVIIGLVIALVILVFVILNITRKKRK